MYRRIRNTGRYLLASLHDFDPETDRVAPSEMLALDRWAVDASYQMQQKILEDYEGYQFHKILKNIMHFCSIQMGAFYFEIIKDRQYTLAADARARRSSQTAIYHLLQAFVRWIAPILSFTADEIWGYMPGQQGDYVFLDTWYPHLFPMDADTNLDADFWQYMLQMRNDVNKAIENGRNQKLFAQSLEVEVELYVKPEALAYIERLHDELRFVFLSSKVHVIQIDTWPTEALCSETGQYAVVVKKTSSQKCTRCWHHVPDVGIDPAHPEICGRCVENLHGDGETRLYV
jgi:isoleucyl-tRNA synthetase